MGAQVGQSVLPGLERTTHAAPAQAAYRDPAGHMAEVENPDACNPEWREPRCDSGKTWIRRAKRIHAGSNVPCGKGGRCYGPYAVGAFRHHANQSEAEAA